MVEVAPQAALVIAEVLAAMAVTPEAAEAGAPMAAAVIDLLELGEQP